MAEQKLCTVCGTVGTTERSMKGKFVFELFLWCLVVRCGVVPFLR